MNRRGQHRCLKQNEVSGGLSDETEDRRSCEFCGILDTRWVSSPLFLRLLHKCRFVPETLHQKPCLSNPIRKGRNCQVGPVFVRAGSCWASSSSLCSRSSSLSRPCSSSFSFLSRSSLSSCSLVCDRLGHLLFVRLQVAHAT